MQKRSHIIGSAFVALAALAPALTFGQNYYSSSNWSTGVTRAEFVRMVLEERGLPLDGTRCFTDVTTQPFASYVCAAKRLGLVTGDPSGRFRPNDTVSLAEAAAILVRAEGVWPTNDAVWYRPYIEQLRVWHALPYGMNPTDHLSYNEASEMVDTVLNRFENDDDWYEDDDDWYDEECDDRYDDWCDDEWYDDDDDHYNDRDLRVTITSSDNTPEPGDRITYRIRLENTSNTEMRDGRINAMLDNDMEFVSASDNGDDYDDEVEWDNLRVPARNTKTLLLTVEIDDHARDGDTLELEVEGGERMVRHTVRVDDEGGNGNDDIRISITDTPDPVREGHEVTYRITFRNMDNDDVTFSPRAYLDNDTDLLSVSDGGEWTGSTVRWNNIDLDDDEERTFIVRVRVKNSADDGDRLVLRVEADDSEDEEETLVDDDGSSDDDDDEDVSISILDTPDPAWPGEQVTYRITLQNNESQDVRVDARAYLDGNTSFLTGSDNAFLESNGQVLWRDVLVRRYESRVILLTLRMREQAPRNGTTWIRVKAGDDERVESTGVR
jgi:uncharacterized repeat protein (TIGR01451 family)